MRHINKLKGILLTIAAAAIFVLSSTLVYAAPFLTAVGGTGTSTPSGILYGDNGATSHLNSLQLSGGLTFSGGVLTQGSSASSTLLGDNNTFSGLNSFTNAGTTTFTGGLSFKNFNITNASATSTAANGIDLANGCFSISGSCLQQIISSASAYKQAVKYASTSTLPSNNYNNGVSGVGATLTGVANGPFYIDGNTPSVGDRVLVKNEGTGANNGIYTVTTLGIVSVSPFVLTRATDYNSNADVFPGVANYVNSGTVNANSCWILTNTSAVIIGTTALTYADDCGAGSFTGTYPIIITGTAISTAFGTTTANTFVTGQNFSGASSTDFTASHSLYVPFAGGLVGSDINKLAYTISTTSMNASITGSAGSVANAHTVSGTLTGSSYNGSAAVSDWAINLGNANIWTAGIVINAASSTINGNATTTGTFYAVTASSTNLYGANLKTCNSGNVLTWTAGLFGCAVDATSAAGDSFTHPIPAQSATTSLMIFNTNGLIVNASTTIGIPTATTTLLGNVMIGNSANGGVIQGTTTALQVSGSYNSYLQTLLWNTNAANNASTDLVFNNGSSTASSYYADVGINGYNFANGLFSGERGNDMFLSSSDGGIDFSLASTTATNTLSSFRWLTKGTLSSNIRMEMFNDGSLALSTTGTTTVANGLYANLLAAPYFDATSTSAWSSLPNIIITNASTTNISSSQSMYATDASSTVRRVTGVHAFSFTLASTTNWTGTSSSASLYGDGGTIYSPISGTITSLECVTNVGTLGVLLTSVGNTVYLKASTTANINVVSLALAKGAAFTIVGGTPASSPTTTPCTLVAQEN